MEDIDDDSDITEDLINMKSNCGIQIEFSDGSLEHFWASQLETYPVLAENTLAELVNVPVSHRQVAAFCNNLPVRNRIFLPALNQIKTQKSIRSSARHAE